MSYQNVYYLSTCFEYFVEDDVCLNDLTVLNFYFPYILCNCAS